MTNYTKCAQILKNAYTKAKKEVSKDTGKSFLNSFQKSQKERISTICDNAESQKALIAVLITSLVKKLETPAQDIRKHQEKMAGGYSGRTLDTMCVTPFIKRHFHRLAMKESGWLTRSFEQGHPYSLRYRGAVRNKELKRAFLRILDDVQEKKANAEKYLIALFIHLIKLTVKTNALSKSIKPQKQEATIDLIIDSLKQHFFQKYRLAGASRLPVLAVYSIYELLLTNVARYERKKLERLRTHTTSDTKEKLIGDIQVTDESGKPFEGIEIKHGIQISADLVGDAYDKFKYTPTRRYYLLTTAEPNKAPEEENAIKREIIRISNEHGCEVIVNGVMPSIKYYLRLLKNPAKFIELYSENLKQDFSETSDIKEEHIAAWKKIIKENFASSII